MYFEESTVEIEGHSGRRSVTLLEAPPVLQIQLQVDRCVLTPFAAADRSVLFSVFNSIGKHLASSNPTLTWHIRRRFNWIVTSRLRIRMKA